jgi:hypothetical protein
MPVTEGAGSLPISFSRRADNCRASSLKALFSTGVSDGGFASPGGRNGKTFFGVSVAVSTGGSTALSKSVGCEVSEAIGSDNSADDATLVSIRKSAGAESSAVRFSCGGFS